MDAFRLLSQSTNLGAQRSKNKTVQSNDSVTLGYGIDSSSARAVKRRKIDTTLSDPSARVATSPSCPTGLPTEVPVFSQKLKLTQLWPKRVSQRVKSFDSYEQLCVDYDIDETLAKNLRNCDYVSPTDVQTGALPLLLSTESKTGWADVDLLSVAPTGSGKTLAFLLPCLNQLMRGHRAKRAASGNSAYEGPQALIIAPTKELAGQIANEAKKLAAKSGIRIILARKGIKFESDGFQHPDREQVECDEESESSSTPCAKPDVIVSTPLALLNAITQNDGVRSLPTVINLILDEADVLLDPLFRDQTLTVWNACTNASLRMSCWSATMGSSIEELVLSTISSRHESQARPSLYRLVVGLKDSSIPIISHKLTYCATEQGKLLALRQLLHPSGTSDNSSSMPTLRPPFLVFTQTISRAIALHSELLYDIPGEAGGSARIAVLHADLSDSARDAIMSRFRSGAIWVLVTTDLLSRGVDFKGINGVVNYDFPNSSAAYVHRVGRTGRAGREGGVAITLYAKEDVPYLKNVANVIAASERQNRDGKDGAVLDGWILTSVPKPSKKEKKALKRRGVESRRPDVVRRDGRANTKTKITTKSGFQKRLEDRRRGAILGSKTRELRDADAGVENDVEDENFSGFGD